MVLLFRMENELTEAKRTSTDFEGVANPAEILHAKAIKERRARRSGPASLETSEHEDGSAGIQLVGKTRALAKLRGLASTGLHNADALYMVVQQLAALDHDTMAKDNPQRANEALAMLDEMEPEDGAQTMLAAQMVAVHVATMSCFTKAMLSDQTFAGRELYYKQAAKLAAIFAKQSDSFERMKRKGAQNVNVKHVHVHNGGQAVVGNIHGQ